MHLLKPNQEYKMVRVELAMPASLDDAEITDGLNELFNHCVVNSEQTGEDFIADWAFPQPGFPIRKTSNTPNEGDLFQG